MAGKQAEVDPQVELTRSQKLTKAYGQATADLRTAHHDEFERLYVKHAKALGETYVPKPTAEAKAKAQLEALLAEHPGLRDQLVGPTVPETAAPADSGS